jgi:hypothetical protein
VPIFITLVLQSSGLVKGEYTNTLDYDAAKAVGYEDY